MFFLNFGSHSLGGTANTAISIAVSPIIAVKRQIPQPHYHPKRTYSRNEPLNNWSYYFHHFELMHVTFNMKSFKSLIVLLSTINKYTCNLSCIDIKCAYTSIAAENKLVCCHFKSESLLYNTLTILQNK